MLHNWLTVTLFRSHRLIQLISLLILVDAIRILQRLKITNNNIQARVMTYCKFWIETIVLDLQFNTIIQKELPNCIKKKVLFKLQIFQFDYNYIASIYIQIVPRLIKCTLFWRTKYNKMHNSSVSNLQKSFLTIAKYLAYNTSTIYISIIEYIKYKCIILITNIYSK